MHWLGVLFWTWLVATVHGNLLGNLTDIGLPRSGHCALAVNGTLYLLGGKTAGSPVDVALRFSVPADLSPPDFQVLDLGPSRAYIHQACAVNSNGVAVFLGSPQWNQTLNLQTMTWNNVTVQGSQTSLQQMAVLDRQVAAMTGDDQLVLLGGSSNNQSVQLSAVLDAQAWSLQDISLTSNTPDLGAYATMVATQQWVFYLVAEPFNGTNNQPYNIQVFAFDPSQDIWLGQVSQFPSWTDQIHVVPLPTSTSNTTLSSLLVLSTPNTTSVPVEMWTLTVSGDSKPKIDYAWLTSSQNLTWIPRPSDTVTLVGNDLVVLAGEHLQLFNTTTRTFVSANWLEQLQPTPLPSTPLPSPRTLADDTSSWLNTTAIIIGSVLGAAVLVLLIILVVLLLRRRSVADNTRRGPPRRLRHLPCLSPIVFSQGSPTNPDATTWGSQVRQSIIDAQPAPSPTDHSMAAMLPRPPMEEIRNDPDTVSEEPSDPITPVGQSRFRENFDSPPPDTVKP